MTSGTGAGGRDRTTEIVEQHNRWLRLQNGIATLTDLINSKDFAIYECNLQSTKI